MPASLHRPGDNFTEGKRSILFVRLLFYSKSRVLIFDAFVTAFGYAVDASVPQETERRRTERTLV